MGKLVWTVTVELSLILCAALAGCATAAPINTPQPTHTSIPTPAPASTPTVPPTQTPVPTLTPTSSPTNTLMPTATSAATQSSTSALPLTLTVEELAGIWKTRDVYFTYVDFRPDGTLGMSGSFPGIKAGMYEVEGQFRVEGDLLSVSDNVCGDTIGVYRVASKAAGKLAFEQVKDECKPAEGFDGFSHRWLYGLLERMP